VPWPSADAAAHRAMAKGEFGGLRGRRHSVGVAGPQPRDRRAGPARINRGRDDAAAGGVEVRAPNRSAVPLSLNAARGCSRQVPGARCGGEGGRRGAAAGGLAGWVRATAAGGAQAEPSMASAAIGGAVPARDVGELAPAPGCLTSTLTRRSQL
jgi:hypothetical protein